MCLLTFRGLLGISDISEDHCKVSTCLRVFRYVIGPSLCFSGFVINKFQLFFSLEKFLFVCWRFKDVSLVPAT